MIDQTKTTRQKRRKVEKPPVSHVSWYRTDEDTPATSEAVLTHYGHKVYHQEGHWLARHADGTYYECVAPEWWCYMPSLSQAGPSELEKELLGKLDQAIVEAGVYLQALRDALDGMSADDVVYSTGMSIGVARRILRIAQEGASGEDVEAAQEALRQKTKGQ
jgi:hypothetical protein